MNVRNEPLRETPIEVRRKALKDRYNKLLSEYELANNQINETIELPERSRREQAAETLYSQLEDVDKQLKKLDTESNNSNLRYLSLEQDIAKIDFDKAVDKIERLIRQFRKGVRGDALLLVQESLSMAGELCIRKIRERLKGETGDFKPIEFEFSPTGHLDKIGFLDGLAKYLGITFTQDTKQYEKDYVKIIIEKICHSLQGGSIVFLEIRKWDALPSHEKELFWFVNKFWIPLVEQLEVITKTHPQVKFISAIVADGKLSSECLKSPILCSNQKEVKIIKLPLHKWKVNDIQIWLESYPGLQHPQSSEFARYVHKTSKGGTPAMVCTALSEEFLK